jgi:hypothetical protein
MNRAAEGTNMTIQEIADDRGLAVNTVRHHRGHDPRFPKPIGRRVSADQRGNPPFEYDPKAVAAFYRAKEAASAQARPGPRRPAGDWDPGEYVDARTAAARLGVTPSVFRLYPSGYPAAGPNPFPARTYRWGDVAEWASSLPARHGPSQLRRQWDPGEYVDARTAAARLGVTYSTFCGYPSGYPAGGPNPFPARTYRWGDVAEWAGKLPARRGPSQLAGDWDPGERVDARTAAARLGVTYDTFRRFPAAYPAGSPTPFPAQAYRWGDVAEWAGKLPARRGPSQPRRQWDPGEYVDARTAAARLGVTYSTFCKYPAGYQAGSANPFPAQVYNWGEIAEWDARRPGSGRRDAVPRRPSARGRSTAAAPRRRRRTG